MMLKSNEDNRINERLWIRSLFEKLEQKTRSIVESTRKNARAIVALGMIATGAQAIEQDYQTNIKTQPSPSGWSLTDAKGESIDNMRELIS